MKLSIAMCTYNGSRFLREQLNSFAWQTRKPDEVVVCDDNSTDDTTEIIEEFSKRAPFPVRLFVNESRLGSTKNFEKAISLCDGDIIALSDQDDIWLPEKLERLETEHLIHESAGLVFCDAELVDENLRSIGHRTWNLLDFSPDWQHQFREGKAFTLLLERYIVSGCMMSFKASYKELILPIPCGLKYMIHDRWIAALISAVGPIIPLDELLVQYRQHGKQQIGLLKLLEINNGSYAFGPADKRSLIEKTQYRHPFDEELERLKALRERLSKFADRFPCKEALNELDQRITHWHVRNNIQDGKVWRVPVVLRELTSRRYHRYSNGINSAMKDLFY